MRQRVLIIGTGPVAQLLAMAMESHVDVVLASRRPEAPAEVSLRRARRGRRARTSTPARTIVDLADVGAYDWSAVISTAPVTEPLVRDVLNAVSSKSTIAAVTQVPSEVEELRKLARGDQWALVVPTFLAEAQSQTITWWCASRALVLLAGPGSDALEPALGSSTREFRRATVDSVLVSAATMMPFVAVLQICDYSWAGLRHEIQLATESANQARRALAAAGGLTEPRQIATLEARAAISVLRTSSPLDLARYARRHFGGHTDQTLTMLDDWINLGNQHGYRVDALSSVRTELTGLAQRRVP